MERGEEETRARSSPWADRPTFSTSNSSFDGHSLQPWLAANRLMARTLRVSPLLTVADSPAFMSSSCCRLPFDARTPLSAPSFQPLPSLVHSPSPPSSAINPSDASKVLSSADAF